MLSYKEFSCYYYAWKQNGLSTVQNPSINQSTFNFSLYSAKSEATDSEIDKKTDKYLNKYQKSSIQTLRPLLSSSSTLYK